VISSGRSTAEAAAPGTINTIVIVDAEADPAALVNIVITVTEVKSLALASAGMRCPGGEPATGTSTDAVVVAATGRGRRCRFGGPISALGWTVARAARTALETGVERWQERHR
jgi:iron complex transport system ATP-binding protein